MRLLDFSNVKDLRYDHLIIMYKKRIVRNLAAEDVVLKILIAQALHEACHEVLVLFAETAK